MQSPAKNKSVHSFQIIRHRGQPNKATTWFGMEVRREEKLWSPEHNRFVMCAPYSEHFIFEIPDSPKTKGMIAFQCTCGSFACVTGMSGYQQDASSQGLLWVCWYHATFGVHVGGNIRWI